MSLSRNLNSNCKPDSDSPLPLLIQIQNSNLKLFAKKFYDLIGGFNLHFFTFPDIQCKGFGKQMCNFMRALKQGIFGKITALDTHQFCYKAENTFLLTDKPSFIVTQFEHNLNKKTETFWSSEDKYIMCIIRIFMRTAVIFDLIF